MHRVEVNCLYFVGDSPVVASWNVEVVTFALFGDLDFAVSEFKEIRKTSSFTNLLSSDSARLNLQP